MTTPSPFVRSASNAAVDAVARAVRIEHRPIAFLIAAVLFCNGAVTLGQSPPIDVRAAAHFLDQATFGPTAAEVVAVQTSGREQWIEHQFVTPASPMPDGLDGNQVRNQLFLNMANGSDQLRQRMMFALSQIIVVSANKTGSGEELTPWVQLLSRNAFGNYRTLLEEVTLSPTMGKYLDLAYNRKASSKSSPNENYAREMLQLFSIGLWQLNQDGTIETDAQGQPIPTYDQNTIREFARAMTGWTFPTEPGKTPSSISNPQYFVGQLEPRTSTHDTDAKVLFPGVVVPAGQAAAEDMRMVLDAVFQHPNVPPFIATRLIRSLVTSNPSPAYVQRVANAFSNNGQGERGDLKAVLKAILLDPEAIAMSAPHDGRLKDPVLHVIGLARALGATVSDPGQYMYVFSNLTQRVLTPTTVFSFYSPLALLPGHFELIGPEFQIYPPALAIQRANFIYGLLNGQYGAGFGFDRSPFRALAGNPAALIDKVDETLMFGRMSDDLRQILLAATNAVPESDANQRALGALYLAAIASEYSVYANSTSTGATVVQPPTGLSVVSATGNLITLRWTAPSFGPVPTGYVMEGGVNRGDVLASMPTGSASPSLTFAAPPGSFYLRVHSIAGGAKSRASSEIRVHVGVPVGPTAPANLLGVAKGSTLGLSWRNTFGGGQPTSIVLDVNGPIVTSIPLGLTETFSFLGVPDGEYTFTVRALNGAGSSGASSPVKLTFPRNGCSGKPQAPINVAASVSGRIVSLTWQASASGAAATSYIVNVTGSFAGTFTTTGRTLSGSVGPGTYNLSVRGVNPCGTGSAAATQTITVH